MPGLPRHHGWSRGEAVKRFQYAIVSEDVDGGIDAIEAILDDLGDKGFQLIAVSQGAIYLMQEREA